MPNSSSIIEMVVERRRAGPTCAIFDIWALFGEKNIGMASSVLVYVEHLKVGWYEWSCNTTRGEHIYTFAR